MTNQLSRAAEIRRMASARFRQLVHPREEKSPAQTEPTTQKIRASPKPFAAAAAPARQAKVVAATA